MFLGRRKHQRCCATRDGSTPRPERSTDKVLEAGAWANWINLLNLVTCTRGIVRRASTFLDSPKGVLVAKQEERKACGKHGPCREEEEVRPVCVWGEIKFCGGKSGNGVKEHNQPVGAFFLKPDDKTDKNQQLDDTYGIYNAIHKVADKIKVLIYGGGMTGPDKFVQRPHNHYEKNAQAYKKEGEWQMFLGVHKVWKSYIHFREARFVVIIKRRELNQRKYCAYKSI